MRRYNYVCMPRRLTFRVISSKFYRILAFFFFGNTCICTCTSVNKQKSTAKPSLNFQTSRRIVFIDVAAAGSLPPPPLISVENPPCLVSIMILHLQSNNEKSIWWRTIFVHETNPHSQLAHTHYIRMEWVLHEDLKHEKLRPLNLSSRSFKLTPITVSLPLSLSLSLSIPSVRLVGLSLRLHWINENPIQTITEIHITLHATLIIS